MLCDVDSWAEFETKKKVEPFTMQCPRCRQHYATEGGLQPRILITCGHSFCNSCIEVLRNDAGLITCPQCGQLSNEPDAPNIALMSYISVQNQKLDPSRVREVPAPRQAVVCQHCNSRDVCFVCYQCVPAGFRFCKSCCEKEHERPFGPVKLHNPVPIDQVKYGVLLPICEKHKDESCELYSFKQNNFVCTMCTMESNYMPGDYIDVQSAVEQVRGLVPPLVEKVSAIRDRLQGVQSKLNDQLSQIDLAKASSIDKVRLEFQDFEMALRKRQAHMESLVEEAASNQKRILNEQVERVEVALGSATTSLINGNILNQMQDYSLLLKASTVIETMKNQILDQVADDLNEPFTSTGISIYISPNFQSEIDKLGMVGGGLAPSGFTASNKHGMIFLEWKRPAREVLEFEIMCDIILNDPDKPNEILRDESFPRHYLVEDTVCQKHIDNLFPNMRYRFRIRSRDPSGWGWWSSSIVGCTPTFPLEIGFTGALIKLPLHNDGMYLITAKGAKARNGDKKTGGRGAIMQAQFFLHKNDFLEVLVGGMSEKRGPCSGGGGGTFVGLNGRQDLLIAAGGGGGTRGFDDDDFDGKDANIEVNGLGGAGEQWAAGGNSGRAGKDAIAVGPCWGYGGAGHVENSTTASSFVTGGEGGEGGGFGGGGGIGAYGGGGGGGYCGGGGGRGGGGGGSYVREDGFNVVREIGNEEHGLVIIEMIIVSDKVVSNDSSNGNL